MATPRPELDPGDHDSPEPASRHRARTIAALLVVALALLTAFAVVDYLLRSHIQTQVEEELAAAQPEVSEDLQVDIAGIFVIPQLLTGTVAQAQMSASTMQVDAFTVRDVHVELRGISLAEPYSAQSVQVRARATEETVQALLADAGVPPGVQVDVADGHLIARAEVFGIPAEADLVPEAQAKAIAVTVTRVRLAGADIDIAELPDGLADGLSDIEVELHDLPAALDLTDLDVTTSGVVLQLSGTGVRLESL